MTEQGGKRKDATVHDVRLCLSTVWLFLLCLLVVPAAMASPPSPGTHHPTQEKVAGIDKQLILIAPSNSEDSDQTTIRIQPESPSKHHQVAASSETWQDRVRFSGDVLARFGQDLHADGENEHQQAATGRARAELRYTFPFSDSESFSLQPSRAPYVILSGELGGLWFGPDNTRDDHDLDLYEAYLNWSHGPLQLRLGKQIVRWGKTDQLSPMDVLNSQDMRMFLLEDREERKIPNWMGRVRFFQDAFTFEGVVVPVFEPNDIHYFGSDWAVYRHLKDNLLEAPVPPPFKDFIRNLQVDENEPPTTWKNMQAGARVTATVHDVDVGLSYYYGFDPMPFVASFPVKNIHVQGMMSGQDLQNQMATAVLTGGDIQVDYLRSHILGAEFETTLGDFGVRGETVYSDSQAFLSSSLASMESSTLFSVLGADYQGPNGWYVDLQLVDQELLDYKTSILFFQRHNLGVTTKIRKDLARGTGEMGLKGMYYVSDASSYLNPYVKWELFSNLDLELGIDLFSGDEDTLLGFYGQNDDVYVQLTYAL